MDAGSGVLAGSTADGAALTVALADAAAGGEQRRVRAPAREERARRWSLGTRQGLERSRARCSVELGDEPLRSGRHEVEDDWGDDLQLVLVVGGDGGVAGGGDTNERKTHGASGRRNGAR